MKFEASRPKASLFRRHARQLHGLRRAKDSIQDEQQRINLCGEVVRATPTGTVLLGLRPPSRSTAMPWTSVQANTTASCVLRGNLIAGLCPRGGGNTPYIPTEHARPRVPYH